MRKHALPGFGTEYRMSAKTMLELKAGQSAPRPGSGRLGAPRRREPLSLAYGLDRQAPAERRSTKSLFISPAKSIAECASEAGVAEHARRYGGDLIRILGGRRTWAVPSCFPLTRGSSRK
jgi:hypothetical protein